MRSQGFESLHVEQSTWYEHASACDRICSAWVRACIAGPAIAFAVSAAMSVVVGRELAEYRANPQQLLSAGVFIAAAILEGGLIGYVQWRVLRRMFPTMSGPMWITATIVAAAAGCVLSGVPTSFALTAALASRIGDVTVGAAAAMRISIVTGALVGLVWGVTQYTVLRLHAHEPTAWILSNTAAWTIGFAAVFFAAFLPDRTMHPAIQIALAAGAGIILGGAVGVLNGWTLRHLHPRLWAIHPGSSRP
jgi:hypothetical protein